MSSKTLSENLLKHKEEIGDIEKFMLRFNPEIQKKLLKVGAGHVECMSYNYPTLEQSATIWGDEGIQLWILVQLEDLNNFCGVKDKMTPAQLKDLSAIILYQYGVMKISEFALFLINFKSGKYGQFYGSVDPLIITNALNEFMTDRVVEFQISERKQEMLENERKRAEWKKTAITYEQYKKEIEQENK